MGDKTHATFDGMAWPLPNGGIEWTLRYGEPSRSQLLHAASIVAAYGAIVCATERKRDRVIRKIREATKP